MEMGLQRKVIRILIGVLFCSLLLSLTGCPSGTASPSVLITQRIDLPAFGFTTANYPVQYVIQNNSTSTWRAADIGIEPVVPLPTGFTLTTNTCNVNMPPQGTCTYSGTFSTSNPATYQLTLNFKYPGGQQLLTPVNADGGFRQTAIGIHVAVGDASTTDTILYSVDNGTSWQAASSITLSAAVGNLSEVIWNGTVYVAVGDSGAILTSTDGESWTQVTSTTTTENLTDVVWNGAEFIAIGNNGTVLISTDKFAATWTAATGVPFINDPGNPGYPPQSQPKFYGITWNSILNKFVIVGGLFTSYWGGPDDSQVVLTSADGNTWALTVNKGATHLFSTIAAGANFIAVGESGVILTSSDGGALWIPAASYPSNLNYNQVYGVAWNGSLYVAVLADGVILNSVDGSNWSVAKYYPANDSFYDVTWGGLQFIAVGVDANSGDGIMITSPDGVNWTTVTLFPAVTVSLNGIL